MITRDKGLKLVKKVFILTRREKFVLAMLSVCQFLASIIEVFALGLIGIFSVVVTARITSQEIDSQSQKFFSPVNHLFSNDTRSLILLGSFAVFFLLLKTVIGIFLNKLLNVSLAKITTRISLTKLVEVAKVRYSWIAKQKIAEFSYYMGPGINHDLKGKLLGSYTIVSEIIFIATVFLFLSISNLVLTLMICSLIMVFFLLIYNFVTKRFKNLNQIEVSYLMKNQHFSTEMFKSFKELMISNNLGIYQEQMKDSRIRENTIRGKMQWLEQLPKFALELFILVFGIIILLISALPSNAIEGATSLIIFSISLTRLTPSFLRLQAAFVLYEASRHRVAGASDFFLSLIENSSEVMDTHTFPVQNSLPVIEFRNVDFEFEPGKIILSNFSCRFEPGRVNCIVGPSGVGKSTVLELALGLISPTRGEILIEKLEPSIWRAANADYSYYLPQEIAILEASLYENIVMSKKSSTVYEEIPILQVLEKVGLKNICTRHPKGLDAVLGEDIQLSGGERQRLGIARALFKQSKILVLDEPTSSLDQDTEEAIFEIFRNIAGECTVILVTHSPKAQDFFHDSLISLSPRGV